MDMTLPQRLYLLGYDLDRHRLDPVGTAHRGQLLSAAALTDLVVSGLLRAREGTVERTVDSSVPDDPFLAAILKTVPPTRSRHWITSLYPEMSRAEDLVRAELVAAGIVSVGQRRLLGLIPVRTIALDRPEQAVRLRERTRDAAMGGQDPNRVPLEDMTLAVLAVEGDVDTVFTARDRWDHRRSLTALGERFDTTFPGLRIAIGTAVRATKGPVA